MQWVSIEKVELQYYTNTMYMYILNLLSLTVHAVKLKEFLSWVCTYNFTMVCLVLCRLAYLVIYVLLFFPQFLSVLVFHHIVLSL